MKTGNVIGVLGGVAAILTAAVVVYQFLEDRSQIDLTGEWKLVNTVESTSYSPYHGMVLGYRIFLNQNGNKVTGNGEKWWENREEIPSIYRTPISIEGKLKGLKLKANCIEKGARRTTTGSFVWNVSQDGKRLKGRFTSTAADAKGTSIGVRVD